MDVVSYLLGKNSGGGSAPTLQDKNVTITTNGSSTVTADSGYTGLGTVGITTNVQPNLETLTETITTNGTTTYTPSTGKDGFSSVSITTNVSGGGVSEYFTSTISNGGYNRPGFVDSIKKLPSFSASGKSLSNAFTTAKNLETIGEINSTGVNDISNMFQGCEKLKSVPNFDTSLVTNMQSVFIDCFELEELPSFNTSNATHMRWFAQNCRKITTVPSFDTSNVTNMQLAFNGCYNLRNVPVFNWTSMQDATNIFGNVYTLTNESVNNILASCISAVDYTGTKTLSSLGFLSSIYPKSMIEGLSNYQDFINEDWTIGY